MWEAVPVSKKAQMAVNLEDHEYRLRINKHSNNRHEPYEYLHPITGTNGSGLYCSENSAETWKAIPLTANSSP